MHRLALAGWCVGSGASGLSERARGAHAVGLRLPSQQAAERKCSEAGAGEPQHVATGEDGGTALIDITELIAGEQNLNQIGPGGFLWDRLLNRGENRPRSPLRPRWASG